MCRLTALQLTSLPFLFRSVDFWPVHLQSISVLELHSVQRLHIQLVCGQRRQVPCCDVTVRLSVTHEWAQNQANHRSFLVVRTATGYFRHIRHERFQGEQRQLYDLGFALWIFCHCAGSWVHSTGLLPYLREWQSVLNCACSYDQNPRARDIAGSRFDVYRKRVESRRNSEEN